MGISVVINTLNEENNIAGCIKSVALIADEIIVCDMYSDDRTVEIAKSHGAKVVFHDRIGFVEPARFFAVSQASQDWVLVLDADERMTDRLARRLRQASSDWQYDVVTCWFRYWYFGNWVLHGGFFNGDWIRFFRKKLYIEGYAPSEETIHQGFNILRKSPNKLHLDREYYIDHYAYGTVEKYISKTLGFYARIEAEQMHAKGRAFRLWRLVYSPIRTFIDRYLLKRGFRDGVRGLILCVLYAGYVFATWANLWLLEEPGSHQKVPQNE